MHIAARPGQEMIRAILSREKPRLSRQMVRQIICRAADIAHIHQLELRPTRVVIVAAGRGSRFDGTRPKILARGTVGRPLLLRTLDTLAPFDTHPLVVVNRECRPTTEVVVQQDGLHDPIWCLQEQQLGTAHALLSIEEDLSFQGDIIVAWGDMGALNERIVFASCALHQLANNVMTIPTKWERRPYVTLLRGADGTIVDVLQARRGDVVPAYGEQDCGVFFIRGPLLPGWLRAIAQRQEIGPTSELDFLALIGQIVACNEQVYALNMGTQWDSQGVNTLLDLQRADTSYARITCETEDDLRAACTVPELLDTLAWSTVHTDLFLTLAHILKRSDMENETGKQETLLNMLPDGKREVLKRWMRIEGA